MGLSKPLSLQRPLGTLKMGDLISLVAPCLFSTRFYGESNCVCVSVSTRMHALGIAASSWGESNTAIGSLAFLLASNTLTVKMLGALLCGYI